MANKVKKPFAIGEEPNEKLENDGHMDEGSSEKELFGNTSETDIDASDTELNDDEDEVDIPVIDEEYDFGENIEPDIDGEEDIVLFPTSDPEIFVDSLERNHDRNGRLLQDEPLTDMERIFFSTDVDEDEDDKNFAENLDEPEYDPTAGAENEISEYELEVAFENIKKILTADHEITRSPKTIKNRRKIYVNQHDILLLNDLCFESFHIYNDIDPQLFIDNQGYFVQIRTNKKTSRVVKKILTKSDLRHILPRYAKFVSTDRSGNEKDTLPSIDLMTDLMATQDKPLPGLDRIVQYPFFSKNGSLLCYPGYNKETRTILDFLDGFLLFNVVENPSQASRILAKKIILEGLFSGFKFETKADEANAIGLLLLFFVRDMINGPTPMAIVESAEYGTGKTLLVESIVEAVTGMAVQETTFPKDESEVRRQLLSHLMLNPTYVFSDNLSEEQKLASAELAQILTGTTKCGRILGQSKMIDLCINAIFITSGVNLDISKEIIRRCYRIRLLRTDSHPHRNHLDWVREYRPQIIWAALTLVKAWAACDYPLSEKQLRSFNNWSGVIGGILEIAGINEFLDNQESFESSADSEHEEFLALINAWWKEFHGNKIKSNELAEFIQNNNIPVILDGRHISQKIRSLGFLLRRIKDRRFGEFIIKDAGLVSGSRCWRLEKTI